jgi:hypothetical protein
VSGDHAHSRRHQFGATLGGGNTSHAFLLSIGLGRAIKSILTLPVEQPRETTPRAAQTPFPILLSSIHGHMP